MQELISKLRPLFCDLDKIGKQTARMSTEDAVDLGYADGADEAYTAIENLISAYANTSQQSKEIEALRGFANKMYSHYLTMSFGAAKDLLEEDFYRSGLLTMNPDQSMSPTKLLAGQD
jgi:hypothetical protein